jgi:opacity protein-like surface antigen
VSHQRQVRQLLALVVLVTAFIGVSAPPALAQGFISPSFGYNFKGDAGCRTATDCEDKNWSWGLALGLLGPVVGFEAELTYDDEFTGERPDESTSVLTMMGNFMVAPKISIVQPYLLGGIGLIKTDIEDRITSFSDSQNQIGWSVGGGLIVFVQQHIGLKGDIRYYHSFQALELLDVELSRDENKIDFGRASFGVVLKF